ncbi:MAG: DUF547 domain-containing protein [Acidobacteriota bacterium]
MHLSASPSLFLFASCIGGLALFAAVADSASAAPAGPGGDSFSHDDWTAVLQKFVDAEGRVDYRGLARDRAVFDRYVSSIENRGPGSTPQLFPTENDRLAYAINAYNAQVFAGVLSRGPEEKSVWSGLISGLNFFVRMKVIIDGDRTNLKKYEEKLILERFEDPRVHAALNCASIGCPRLPQEAFLPATLDARLDAAMTEWVHDPRHIEVDAAARTVRLSKIFDWFSKDFLDFEKKNGGARKPTLVDYVNRFRSESEQIPRDFEVDFLPYDKGINKQ